MIQRLFMLFPLQSLALCLATVVPGCIEPTATYHFRVIDAETGKPLEHVRVQEGWNGSHWHNRLFPDTGFKELKPTDADGVTVAPAVVQTDAFVYSFWFESGGYKNLAVTDGGGSYPWLFRYTDDPFETPWPWKGLKTVETDVAPNGKIVVPMYRLGVASSQK